MKLIPLLSVMLFGSFAAKSNDMKIISSSIPGLTLQKATSVDRTTSSQTNASLFLSSYKPYALDISNDGTKPIIGIAVRYQIKKDGRTNIRSFFYHSLNHPTSPLLPPRASITYMPHPDANAAIRTTNQSLSATQIQRLEKDYGVLDQAEIEASIDLVIFNDGSSVGPDAASNLERLKLSQVAVNEMLAEATQRLSSDSDEELRNWIQSCQTIRIIVGPNRQRDFKSMKRKEFAMAMDSVYQKGGRKALSEYISGEKQATPYTFVRK